MTTAAKYGAQDLNGNPFNYQQLVPLPSTNPSTTNTVVNTNITNRAAYDARVRVALTNTPIGSQVVSNVHGSQAFLAQQSAASTLLETQQFLTIDTASSITNAFSTASYIVTSTTENTNVITVSSTATFTIGQPVVFSASAGNLTAGTVYYILTIPSSTTFTVSPIWNGAVQMLTTSTYPMIVQQTVNNLSVGMPVNFHGTTFGYAFYNMNYYVASLPGGSSGTTFTISLYPGGPILPLISAIGTMSCVPVVTPVANPQTAQYPTAMTSAIALNTTAQSGYNGTLQGITVTASTTSTNILTTASFSITSSTAASGTLGYGYLTTSGNAYLLTAGQPIVFNATVTSSALFANVTYYVHSVLSSTTFSVSTSYNGNPISISTNASITGVTMYLSTNYLQTNQQIIFTGTSFGNIVPNTPYYISTVPSNNTFTVSTWPGGPTTNLTTTTGTMVASAFIPPTLPQLVFGSSQAGVTLNVSATTVTTNLITVTSTTGLVANQPIVFSASIGGLIAGTTYYVVSGFGATTFQVSATQGGSVFSLTSGTGTLTAQALPYFNTFSTTVTATTAGTNLITVTNTSNFVPGQPVVFASAVGGLSSNTVYYVLNVYSTTQISVSPTQGGVAFPLITTTSQSVAMSIATTGLATNQPLQIANVTVLVTATATTGNAITCNNTVNLVANQPIIFASTIGTITSGTVYYVSSILTSTTFTISLTSGGAVYSMSNASGSLTAQQGTFAGVVPGQVYYVYSAPSLTQVVISSIHGAPTPLALTTVAAGSMLATFQSVIPTITLGTSTATGSVYALNNTYTTSTYSIGSTTTTNVVIGSAVPLMTGQPVTFVIGGALANSNGIVAFVSVTGTTASTNIVTLASTTGLVVGQALVFSASGGGLITGTVYYITSISGANITVSLTPYGTNVTLTTATLSFTGVPTYYITYYDNPSNSFQISGTYGGPIVALTAGIPGSSTVQHATTNLLAGQPIYVTGTAFGGTTTNTTYYVRTIPSATQFTISTSPFGQISTLTSTTGTMPTLVGPRPVVTIASSVTSNQLSTQTYPVTATTATTNLITVANTFALSVGMPVVFSGSLGNLISGTIYYVASIPTATAFSVSPTPGGNTFVLATATGSVNVQQATSLLYINQEIQFQGYTYPLSTATSTGITFGTTYFVNSIVSTTLFTISTAQNVAGTAATTATVTGGNIVLANPIVNNIVDVFAYTTTPITVTATSSTGPTYYLTCSSTINTLAPTTNLAVGQPIVFTGTTLLGGITANTVYYINSIASGTQFNISSTYGGPIISLTSGSGSMSVQQATTGYSVNQTVILNSPTVTITGTNSTGNLLTCNTTNNLIVGQPIVFGNMAQGTASIGNVVSGTTYYVLTIVSATTFTISATPSGTVFSLATTSTQFAGQQGIFGQQYNTNGQNWVVQSTPNLTSLVLSRIGASITQSGLGLFPLPAVAPITVTATSGTSPYNITVSSTGSLTVGQPIVFIGTTFGGLTASVNSLINPTVYYVNAITSSTTFNVNTTGTVGTPTTLTGASGNCILAPLSATGIATAYSYNTTPTLSIGSTTTTTNVLTTQAYAVTLGASGTNLISVTTSGGTTTFVLGQPVTFAANTGSITGSLTYYISSIQSTTTFSISQFFGGPDLVITGSGSTTMNQITSFLQLNQPVTFTGTLLGGLTAASNYTVTYYVTNVTNTTSFVVGTQAGGVGTALSLTTTTATAPSFMTAQVGSYRAMSFNSTNNGTAVLQTESFAVTATAAVNNGQMLVTANNTFALYPGCAISFSAALGILSNNILYYVLTVYDEKRFTVTTAPVNSIGVTSHGGTLLQTVNGTMLTQQTTTGSISVTQSTSRLQQNQAVVFYPTVGTAMIAGLTQGTIYYVQAVNPITGTIAISTTPGGSALTLSAVNNTGTTQSMMMVPLTTWATAANVMVTQPIPLYYATTSSNIFTTGYLTVVTNTSYGSNYITCYSTSNLAVGMPVVFSTSIGSLSSGTTYYVVQIINSTQFTVSQTWGGQVAILTQGTSAVTLQASTAGLVVGQPMFLTGTGYAPISGGNITPYTTYYVATVPSATTFTLATSLANAVAGTSIAISTTTYGYMTITGSTANYLTNMSNVIGPSQPIAFTGAQINITIVNGTNLYTPNSTILLSANQAVVFTGYGYTNQTSGTIQPGTVYYIKTILDNNTFTLSATPGGTVISWVTETNTLTMQIVSSLGSSLVPYSTYFVLSTPTLNTFQIATSATTASGLTLTLPSAVTQTAGNTIVNIASNIVTLSQAQGATNTFFVPNTPVTFTAYSGSTFGVGATAGTSTFNGAPVTGTPFFVTAVATNGNITLNTSAASLLVVGQPIVFTNPLSPITSTTGVLPFVTYYVLTISTTTITVASSWPSTTAVTFSAAWSSQSTVGGFYAIPHYYVKAVLDSRRVMLSATINGSSWPITNASGTVPGNYASGTNVMTINSLPSYTDFIEHDVTLSPNGTFERTGILVPPNTYLYVSSNQPQVTAVAIGIQESV